MSRLQWYSGKHLSKSESHLHEGFPVSNKGTGQMIVMMGELSIFEKSKKSVRNSEQNVQNVLILL